MYGKSIVDQEPKHQILQIIKKDVSLDGF